MAELSIAAYAAIAVIFIWTGFVRSFLGFGGAALGLPFLLLFVDSPLVVLPIIATHLLIFSSWTLSRKKSAVDVPYVRKALAIMMVPMALGLFGLLNLPGNILSGIVYAITLLYAVSYIINKQLRSESRLLDNMLLLFGGYVSGTSLIGAPLIVAATTNQVAIEKLRDTLFVLWFVIVSIKMAAFIAVDVDLQIIHSLWLFPFAALGHYVGMRLHDKTLGTAKKQYKQTIGIVMLFVSAYGLYTL